MIRSIRQAIEAPEPAPFWSVLTALLFVLAYAVVLVAAQALSITLLGGDLSNPAPDALALGLLIAGILNTVVIFQWVGRHVDKASKTTGDVKSILRLRQGVRLPLFVVILLGLAGAWAIDLIGVITRLKGGQVVPPALDVLVQPNAPLLGWAIAAVVAIVVQPLSEGLTFSGLLYPALGTRFGNLISILLTSVIFAAMNVVFGGSGLWYLLIQPLLMGLWVTTLRAYTQSTQMAIVARAAFGLFFVLSALISARF